MDKQERADRLYNLLPATYRIRDAATGWQLQALLRVIAEQVNAVEDDISQLYANWFIETCQDWVVPYIGDLIGYQQIHDAGEPGDITTAEGQARNAILIPRRDVANTLHYRRRRGTLAVLEELARDVANWPYAYAVEFYKHLGITQNDDFLRIQRGRLINLRDHHALFALGSPFERAAHTVDVRRPLSQHAPGRYNIPDVGLFLWRLQLYPVVMTRAYRDETVETHYTFSVLGNDSQLYTHPAPRQASNGQPQIVDELNFPNPISVRAFEKRLHDYYGDVTQGKSLEIWTVAATHPVHTHEEQHEHHPHHEHHEHHEPHPHQAYSEVIVEKPPVQPPASPPQQPVSKPKPQLVLPKNIVATDLSNWHYRPQQDQVAVDTHLGRIAFARGHAPESVYVSYYYAFSADIGGGIYNRPILQPTNTHILHVNKDAEQISTPATPSYPSIQKALDAWQQWKTTNMQLPIDQQQPLNGIIEITDNGRYTLRLAIDLEENEHLVIRAANRTRPILHLIDKEEDKGEDEDKEEREEPIVTGEYGSRFALDGLLVMGSPLRFEGTIDTVAIRHCTLVPGRGIDSDCNPHYPDEASILLYHKGTRVNIEQSILGSLLVEQDEVHEEPLHLNISDSILDATSEQRKALSSSEDSIAYSILNITRSTVFGQVQVHAIDTVENSILLGSVTVARRQHGCMRFCSIVPGSRTPRRYSCQPDLAEQALNTTLKGASQEQRNAAIQITRARVRPSFASVRYGDASYCQLTLSCAQEIRTGADDESEMGVFHDLFQPQRETNLRARLADFTPAGMETAIIYIN